MKNHLVALTTLLFFLQTAVGQRNSPLAKEATIKLYNSLYVSSEVDGIVWNGSLQNCNSGSLPNSIYAKVQNRINFFRLVNGLNKVQNSGQLNKDAQSAALLVKANNQLTHNPESSMTCYSISASNGCQKSCLGITDWANYRNTAFITGFISDFGASNYFVGHRRWLLYSKLSEFGYGATSSSEAVLTADGVDFDLIPAPGFIAYPWNGFVPVGLIFPKWSFSIPEGNDVDFSKCAIAMLYENGKKIAIERLDEYKNYLDHTIVWTAKGLFNNYEIQYAENNLAEKGFLNKKITVNISGVLVNGESKTFNYSVTPIKI